MKKEVEFQAKVEVEIETLWTALSKDLSIIIPKVLPDSVTKVEVVEEDGFSFLLKICPDVTRNHKEKIVDFDEVNHQIGLQLVEGAQLNYGFSYYKSIYQLTADGESKTLVNIKVVYECEGVQSSGYLEKALKGTEYFYQLIGNYLQNEGK